MLQRVHGLAGRRVTGNDEPCLTAQCLAVLVQKEPGRVSSSSVLKKNLLLEAHRSFFLTVVTLVAKPPLRAPL